MAKCIRCGEEYHIDKQERKNKDALYVVHCKKCGHLLKRVGHMEDPSNPGIFLKDHELLGGEIRELESRQAGHEYNIERDKKRLREEHVSGKKIKDELDSLEKEMREKGYSNDVIERELSIKKEELVKGGAEKFLGHEKSKRLNDIYIRKDISEEDKELLRMRVNEEFDLEKNKEKLEEEIKKIKEGVEKFEGEEKEKEAKEEEKKELEAKKHRTVKLFDKWQNKVGKKVMDGFMFAALVGIGVIISATIGAGWMMILAFMSFGVYFILPNPDNIEIPKEIRKKIESISKEQFKEKSGPTAAGGYYVALAKHYFTKGAVGNSAVGILRSITKLGGFALVIMSLTGTGVPMVNIIIIIIAFAAYYSCKIVYDPLKPHETIESLFRFGFLGIYVIPIFIFISQFDSWVLGGIAFAFFAIPPIPKEKGNEEMYAATELFMKALFALIMIAVLVGFFAGWSGWSLPTAMKTTFLYFFIITFISGVFSPSEARPGVGFIMLAAATIIYGIGPGQQELMSGLLGPWWPTLQNSLVAIGQPLSDAFGGIGNTFSSGWLLMTNPVGYATQLMNGTHAQNPQGVTGAHGIEFSSFTISEIYPNQPFMANVIIRNNGAFEAENVRLYMTLAGGDLPSGSMTINNMKITPCAAASGLQEGYYIDKDCLYSEGGNYFSGDNPSMERQFVNQYSFEGEVICDAIKDFDLREKAIPLRARVVYDYQVDSNVDVEFISKDEWDRLARDNLLDAQLKFVQSQYSSAPVKLPIGTAGLKNPILATQTFHISILLDNDMGKKSMIKDTESIGLAYPADWTLRTNSGCTVKPSKTETASDVTRLTFDYSADRTAGAKTIVCHFNAIGDKEMGGSPTKTYKVTAHANYTFEMWKDLSTRIAFGGFCCSDKDCPTGYECDKEVTNSCRVKGSSNTGTGNGETPEDVSSLQGYCAKRLSYESNEEGKLGCLLGMGGCSGHDECAPYKTDVQNFELWLNPECARSIRAAMACTEISGYGIKACCYSGSKPEACKAAFEEWLNQTKSSSALLSVPYLYPDEKTIHEIYDSKELVFGF